MEDKDKLRLQAMHTKLVQDVDPTEIVPNLIQAGILSDNDIDQIRRQITRREKVSTLLHILPRKGPKAFETFCASLTESYDWLAKELKSADVMSTVNVDTRRSQAVTNEVINVLRQDAFLQRRWQALAHALNLGQQIFNIQSRSNIYMWDADQCIAFLLEQWQEQKGKAATIGALLEALRMEKFNSVADNLEERFLVPA